VVEYEPLPVADHRPRRSRPRASRAISGRSSAATPTTALKTAAHRFSGDFEFGGQEHFYLETNCALALIDEDGQIFVQSSTQHPSETQEIVAPRARLDSHHITVQCLRMGGGFGGKEMQPHGFAAIAALGATLTGRPVRLRLNRTQDITMTGKRHPYHTTFEAGFDDDGKLVALRATLTSDGGWSLTCPSRCWRGHSATSTTPTGCPTSTCTAGSPRPTSAPRPRSAASVARRA
jgi:xanthine dehydrogenase large subunit